MQYLNHIYNDRRRYFFNNRNQQLLKNKNVIDIMFVGDSITENYNINRYIAPTKVILNSGVGGDLTSTLLMRLNEDVVAHKPKNVVLLIGINDIRTFFTNECISPNINTIDDIKKVIPQNIIKIINILKENNINVYWTRILPINEFEINSHYINFVIEEVNDIVEKQLNDVCVIKHDVLTTYDGRLDANYTYDGVHLHDDGYLAMTNNLVKYIDL